MQHNSFFIESYEVGDFTLDITKDITYNGLKSKVVFFIVEIMVGFDKKTYEIRRFKSKQAAQRFCQHFVERHTDVVL